MAAEFSTWLHIFVSEKGLDLDHRFEKDGPSGMLNSIPLENVVAAINLTSAEEQRQIKNQLVMLDFRNADVMGYFDHLAGALAI